MTVNDFLEGTFFRHFPVFSEKEQKREEKEEEKGKREQEKEVYGIWLTVSSFCC